MLIWFSLEHFSLLPCSKTWLKTSSAVVKLVTGAKCLYSYDVGNEEYTLILDTPKWLCLCTAAPGDFLYNVYSMLRRTLTGALLVMF